MISSEFCEISKSTFFAEHRRTVISLVISPVKHCSCNLLRQNETQVSNFQKVGSPVMKKFSFFFVASRALLQRYTEFNYTFPYSGIIVSWIQTALLQQHIRIYFSEYFLKVAPVFYAPRILLIVIFIWWFKNIHVSKSVCEMVYFYRFQ